MLVLGRTAGVHFVFATHRPDEVVMSPSLRCGFPGRIAFKVAFEEDSRMIIGEKGADRLNGKRRFPVPRFDGPASRPGAIHFRRGFRKLVRALTRKTQSAKLPPKARRAP